MSRSIASWNERLQCGDNSGLLNSVQGGVSRSLTNSRYATFNTRYDKLNSPRLVGYTPYRQSRCIIPASGFVEGLEGTKSYYLLEAANEAIAFGGLYRIWVHEATGEMGKRSTNLTLPKNQRSVIICVFIFHGSSASTSSTPVALGSSLKT